MNKKVTSLILVFVMLFSLVANTMPVHAASHNEFVVTANKTEINPGDTVTYSVVVGPNTSFVSAQFTLVIPEGLTFESAAVASGLTDFINGLENNSGCFAEFDKSAMTFYFATYTPYTSEAETLLMTFTCTVDDDADGVYEIKIADDCDFGSADWTSIDMHVNTAPSKVCTHSNTTETPAVESTCTEQGTGAYTTCDDCGEVIEGSTDKLPVDPDNHVNVTTVPAVEGSCVEEGHEEYSFCTDCGSIVSGSDDPVVGPHGALVEKVEEEYLMNEADCLNPAVYYKSCALCGEASATETFEYGTALGHDYAADVIDPSCTEGGYTVYTCVCGDSYIADETPALDHVYYADVIEPTCTEDGYTIYTCENCGDSYIDNLTPMAHKYQAIVTAPTCTKDGYTSYYCEFCDESYVDDVVPALGHSFTNYDFNGDATCTEDGTKTALCDRCTEWDTIVAEGTKTGHEYDAFVTAPTCTAAGYTTYVCACGDSYQADEVTALGHSFTNYVYNDDATCTEDGTKTADCDRCSATDTVVADGTALGHIYDTVEVEPTCTQKGYTTYTCAECGDTYVADYVDALGHNYSTNWSKDETGHWHVCLACGDVTDFADHDFDGDKCAVCAYERDHVHALTLVPAVEATCTTEGNVAYYTCSGCESWFEDANGTTVILDKNTVVVAALGHKYDSVVTAPTCTDGGYTTYTCAVCGDVYTADEVAALGHKYDVVETAPTCTEFGIITYTCAVCGDSYKELGLPATGHAYTPVVTAPTCTEDGYTTYTCACGDTYTGDEVAATGHNYINGICGECDAEDPNYVKPEEPTEPSEPTEPEQPTEPEEPTEPEQPTEPSEPEQPTEPSEPEKPNKPHRPIWECWKGNHEYESVVTEPTCESKGYTTHTCKYCHKSYKDSFTRPLGHDWDEGKVVKEATCRKDGMKVFKCENCDKTHVEKIKSTGHQYVSTVVKSTCEDWGYTSHACENCHKSYKDSWTAPLGHRWGRGKVTKEATCTKNGEKTFTCRNCNETKVETIKATGHWFWHGKCANCGKTQFKKHGKFNWWK